MTALLCLCACPDREAAAHIANTLVEERLAACASILPTMQSVYRWQGEVVQADEVMLLIKTVQAQLPSLQARLLALHPYEVPELLAFAPDSVLPSYLEWLSAQTMQ